MSSNLEKEIVFFCKVLLLGLILLKKGYNTSEHERIRLFKAENKNPTKVWSNQQMKMEGSKRIKQ